MRRVAIGLVLVAMCLAPVTSRAAASKINACGLLVAAVHEDVYWSIHLTKRVFTPAGAGAWRCELTSAPPQGSVSPRFELVLSFFASPTVAAAHSNVVFLLRKGKPLRGAGTDEAFATENHEAGSTSTRVTWRKGRYWGWLSVAGPKLVGDREDAADLLKRFAGHLPSS